MTRPAGARGETAVRLCAQCLAPIRGGKPSALAKRRYCSPRCVHLAQQKPPPVVPLLDVVRRLLDFGVPMGGNAGDLVCSYCGQPWEQVRAAGHRADCLWIALRDAAVRETL